VIDDVEIRDGDQQRHDDRDNRIVQHIHLPRRNEADHAENQEDKPEDRLGVDRLRAFRLAATVAALFRGIRDLI
jgi:hypothetical protein